MFVSFYFAKLLFELGKHDDGENIEKCDAENFTMKHLDYIMSIVGASLTGLHLFMVTKVR